jgi:phosphoribosylaminoimidazolecarboxamide formyltransferase/IMP cyclohydrolase
MKKTRIAEDFGCSLFHDHTFMGRSAFYNTTLLGFFLLKKIPLLIASDKSLPRKAVTKMAHILSSLEGAKVDLQPVTRALLSVSDKNGLIELATILATYNVELLSTGGTAKALRDAGFTVIDVSDYTGSPEILDGRVKTLHPKVHGGLLGVRGNPRHESEMAANDIRNIDLVVMNLYPFESTVASGAEFPQCIENIDIGGPSMLRSSAKNHAYVAIITSPVQYQTLIDEMKANNGATTLATRKKFAARAFATSAAYDAAISSYFASQLNEEGVTSVVTRAYQPG